MDGRFETVEAGSTDRRFDRLARGVAHLEGFASSPTKLAPIAVIHLHALNNLNSQQAESVVFELVPPPGMDPIGLRRDLDQRLHELEKKKDRPGDKLMAVNGKTLKNAEEVAQAFDAEKHQTSFTLQIYHWPEGLRTEDYTIVSP